MDKLEVLAEFEKIAFEEGLESGEFRLFLLLLANCDHERGRGEIRPGAVAAALGRGESPAWLERAFRRLAGFGLVEPLAPFPERITGDDPVVAFRIPLLTSARR